YTGGPSSAASDVYKRQVLLELNGIARRAGPNDQGSATTRSLNIDVISGLLKNVQKVNFK
ncbi:hypothetical protein, partial [Ralstonia pseudosolanacearum]|uniref:hypothetical protein n=1 Tax=Ralstonia pseudosolanacearum TaxID=1310165 RepID=UPI001FFBBBD4